MGSTVLAPGEEVAVTDSVKVDIFEDNTFTNTIDLILG